MTARLVASALSGLLLAALLTPGAIRVALALELIDVPVGWKRHRRPTPLLGGAAIVVATCFSVAIFGSRLMHLAPVLAGTVLLCAVGTLDDRHQLSAAPRLCVEALAALGLWVGGFGWHLGIPGPVSALLTVLWVIAVVNAVNLLDVMDGLAATISLVILLAGGILVLLDGDPSVAAVALAASGAAAGFLPYNVAHPSRIFAGDGGTMPLGFLCATVTMALTRSPSKPLASLLCAALLMLVPFADMSVRAALRVRRGVSVMTPGHDSLLIAHVERRVISPHAVCVAIALLQAAVATAAFAARELTPDLAAEEMAIVLVAVALLALWMLQEPTRLVEDVKPALRRRLPRVLRIGAGRPATPAAGRATAGHASDTRA